MSRYSGDEKFLLHFSGISHFRVFAHFRIFAFSVFFSLGCGEGRGECLGKERAGTQRTQRNEGHSGRWHTADNRRLRRKKRVHDRGQDRRIQLQRSESAKPKIRRLPNGVAYRERSVSTEADQMLQCIEGRYWHDVVGGRREAE